MDGLAVCGSIFLETLILNQLRRCLQAIPDRYAIVCVFLLALSLSVSVSSLSHPVFLMPLMEGLPICGSILLENPNSLPAKVLFTSNIIYRYATGCIFLLPFALSVCPLYLILRFLNAINAWSCRCGSIC
jgi:hypothetical protein